MLEIVMSLFSSSGIGALFGLVGSWLTKREERRNVELRLSHEKDMARLENKNLLLRQEHQVRIAEYGVDAIVQQGEYAVEQAEAAAFIASQASNQPLINGFTEFVRGLMRPVITLYLLLVASFVAWHINDYMVGVSDVMREDEVIDIFRVTLDRIMFLTTTAVTWWFGSRPASERKSKY